MHNGIEYADMQMIAEIYGVMRDGLGMTAPQMAEVFAGWNTGKLNSYPDRDHRQGAGDRSMPRTGKPLVDVIVDRAGQKGTGKWSVIEAQHLGVPATTLEAAVAARVLSSMKDERIEAEKVYAVHSRAAVAPASTADTIRQLESALYAGKIAAYAQGFAVMAAGLRRTGLEAAARHHRQHLARGLHHPLAVPRSDHRCVRERAPATC